MLFRFLARLGFAGLRARLNCVPAGRAREAFSKALREHVAASGRRRWGPTTGAGWTKTRFASSIPRTRRWPRSSRDAPRTLDFLDDRSRRASRGAEERCSPLGGVDFHEDVSLVRGPRLLLVDCLRGHLQLARSPGRAAGRREIRRPVRGPGRSAAAGRRFLHWRRPPGLGHAAPTSERRQARHLRHSGFARLSFFTLSAFRMSSGPACRMPSSKRISAGGGCPKVSPGRHWS